MPFSCKCNSLTHVSPPSQEHQHPPSTIPYYYPYHPYPTHLHPNDVSQNTKGTNLFIPLLLIFPFLPLFFSLFSLFPLIVFLVLTFVAELWEWNFPIPYVSVLFINSQSTSHGRKKMIHK